MMEGTHTWSLRGKASEVTGDDDGYDPAVSEEKSVACRFVTVPELRLQRAECVVRITPACVLCPRRDMGELG
jgi:hypothetical protein